MKDGDRVDWEESEIQASKRDPRLTAKALAARNVDLTGFELV